MPTNSVLKLRLILIIFLFHLTQQEILVKQNKKTNTHNDIHCEPSLTFFSLVPDFHSEDFFIETQDNYILTVFRVQKDKSDSNRDPVLLIHGVVDSSDEFALDKDSIVHKLVNKNFDVWLLNSRGNKYSCRHSQFSPLLPKFWDFSFQEMAKFDFPAVLKYIMSKTSKKVSVIGHSQGTSQVFAAFSEIPNLSDYIHQFQAIAPIVHMTGFDPESVYNFMISHNFLGIAERLGFHSILQHTINTSWETDWFLKLVCSTNISFCKYVLSKLTDKDPSKLDQRIFRVMLEHNPSRCNIKSLKHFMQLVINYDGIFRKYDYGKLENMGKYGCEIPPTYDMSKVNVPVFMYYGDNDVFLNVESVLKLKGEITGSKTRFYPGWGHMCYFWGIDRQIFVSELLEDLENRI